MSQRKKDGVAEMCRGGINVIEEEEEVRALLRDGECGIVLGGGVVAACEGGRGGRCGGGGD